MTHDRVSINILLRDGLPLGLGFENRVLSINHHRMHHVSSRAAMKLAEDKI